MIRIVSKIAKTRKERMMRLKKKEKKISLPCSVVLQD